MGAVWGRGALLASTVFGLLATGIQALAYAIVRPGKGPFPRNWVVGMGLRLGGVAAFAVVVSLAPDHFPALPAGLGYLGVLVPLLFLEAGLKT